MSCTLKIWVITVRSIEYVETLSMHSITYNVSRFALLPKTEFNLPIRLGKVEQKMTSKFRFKNNEIQHNKHTHTYRHTYYCANCSPRCSHWPYFLALYYSSTHLISLSVFLFSALKTTSLGCSHFVLQIHLQQ